MGQYYDDKDVVRAKPLQPLSEQTINDISAIREAGQAMIEVLAALPQSADMTLAKRKTEEAVMWAVKAITA